MNKMQSYATFFIAFVGLVVLMMGCSSSEFEEDCEFVCQRGFECGDGGAFDSEGQCVEQCTGAAEVAAEFDPTCEALSRDVAVCIAAIPCELWDEEEDELEEEYCEEEVEAYTAECQY